jgi:hypothetical protein
MLLSSAARSFKVCAVCPKFNCQLNMKLFAYFAVACLRCSFALGDEQALHAADFESQEKVVKLIQRIIEDYWNGSDNKSSAATNGAANYTNVESAFREASRLMPSRLDLRYCLASSLVAQAVATNGLELKMKLNGALRVYQEIQALDTNSFDAPIMYAAYSRAVGETNESNAVITLLSSIHPQQTAEYVQKFINLDHLLEMVPNEKPRRTMPRDKHHAIVVLGAGLETNGTLKPKLDGRLQQGLRLARMYPKAPMILTGGNQKGGVTEAYVMGAWLVNRGINRKRVYLEDTARNTVENALFSSAILKRLGVTHVTVVTSSSHLRRGMADLEEACRQRGLDLQYDGLAITIKGDAELDIIQERLGVYRDFLRTSGIWAFPGLQR